MWFLTFEKGIYVLRDNGPAPSELLKVLSINWLLWVILWLYIQRIFQLHSGRNRNVDKLWKLYVFGNEGHCWFYETSCCVYLSFKSCVYVRIQNLKFVKHLIVIGRLSFFIYLTHALFLYAFSHISFPDLWFLRFVACVCLSYGMALLLEKRCTSKMKKYLGF